MTHIGTGSSLSLLPKEQNILYLNWGGGSETANTASLPNAIKFGECEEATMTGVRTFGVVPWFPLKRKRAL